MNRILHRRQIWAPTRQSGASAVEFAFIFPIMLAVFYATVVYSYVFFLQQSINFAAQQGVQAAVAVVPTGVAKTDSTNRAAQALSVVQATLNWLPSGQVGRVSEASVTACPGGTAASNTFGYQINFLLGSGSVTNGGSTASFSGALFPTLTNLPMGLGSVPPLPTLLTACAVAFD